MTARCDDATPDGFDALVQFSRIDVRDVVTTVLAKKHQVAVTAAVPEGPVWVDGDAASLQQILSKLISTMATGQDPSRTIGVHVTPDEDQVVVKVREPGGLDQREIRRICRELVNRRSSGGDHSSGDLRPVWALAQAHGATIHVRSEGTGKGSEIRLILPAT